MTPEERCKEIQSRFTPGPGGLWDAVTQAIREAIEAEREACARLATSRADPNHGTECNDCEENRMLATAIRSRGKT